MTSWMDEITDASEGLLFPSETDAPLRLFVWDAPAPFSVEALREARGYAEQTPIATLDIDQFFSPATRSYDWHGPAEQERVRRFGALVETLKAHLRDIAVCRVGASGTIDVFVVGRTDDGSIAGVTTQVVET
ncbi:MAG TPA: nuclease A inhibitor family protein [Herpetosiphonaceae bacterium]